MWRRGEGGVERSLEEKKPASGTGLEDAWRSVLRTGAVWLRIRVQAVGPHTRLLPWVCTGGGCCSLSDAFSPQWAKTAACFLLFTHMEMWRRTGLPVGSFCAVFIVAFLLRLINYLKVIFGHVALSVNVFRTQLLLLPVLDCIWRGFNALSWRWNCKNGRHSHTCFFDFFISFSKSMCSALLSIFKCLLYEMLYWVVIICVMYFLSLHKHPITSVVSERYYVCRLEPGSQMLLLNLAFAWNPLISNVEELILCHCLHNKVFMLYFSSCKFRTNLFMMGGGLLALP